MELKKLTIVLLVILMLTGVKGVSANPPEAPDDWSPISAQGTLAASTWQQVNSSGFGDPGTGEVTALEAFNGYLYAGTHNPIDPEPLFDGAQIFRSPDGASWSAVTQPGFGNSHDIAPPAILDFTVFGSNLYASTGRGNASQIWRSQNGTTWAPMDVTGFSNPDNVDMTVLGVYSGMIYAGITNQITGAQIWHSFTGDNNSWTQMVVPAVADSRITGMAEFNGGLYAAVEFEWTCPGVAQLRQRLDNRSEQWFWRQQHPFNRRHGCLWKLSVHWCWKYCHRCPALAHQQWHQLGSDHSACFWKPEQHQGRGGVRLPEPALCQCQQHGIRD